MKPTAQRIAIAEACGWGLIEKRDCEITGPASWLSGLNPKPDKIELVVEAYTGNVRPPNEADYGWERLPDYPTDLNACHEMEKGLTEEQLWDYLGHLFHITAVNGKVEPMQQVRATAAQRCEAFLRTIGKWQPDAAGEGARP